MTTNLICKKDLGPCRTPGMCAPHGGCPGIDVEAGRKLVAENDRLFKLLERMIDQMLPVEEMKNLPGYSRVLTAEVLLAERDQLKAENRLLRHQLAASALELRKASSWICREVEAGTASATHWAIRLRTNAEQIDAAIGKDSRHD